MNLAWLLAAAAGPIACASTTAREQDRPFTAGLAEVTRVAARVSGSAPPRVELLVEGRLPDGCTQLEPARSDRRGIHFEVTLPTRRPFGSTCPPAPTPFATTIALREAIFETGAYVATVNGVSTDFTVVVDASESELYRPGIFDD